MKHRREEEKTIIIRAFAKLFALHTNAIKKVALMNHHLELDCKQFWCYLIDFFNYFGESIYKKVL